MKKVRKIIYFYFTVFPEPVWAQPMRSLPDIIIGIACFWIGVGFLYPALNIFSTTYFLKSAVSKLSIARGAFSPLTCSIMLQSK